MRYLFLIMIILSVANSSLAQQNSQDGRMEVGVAQIDITPDGPIRLAGYGSRKKSESEGVLHPIAAKALAFGSDAQGPSVMITVDLVGIPGHVTTSLAQRLSKKAGIKRANFTICASHTHGGPEVGNLLNILQYRDGAFSDSLLQLQQLQHISLYIEQLTAKLEQVALSALKNRSLSVVSWGQGQLGFAKNRRQDNGPVDHAMPLLAVKDLKGNLKAVLVNYACHGTTLDGDMNQVHGDWMGEAQRLIQVRHPGTIAMVAIGCGADANPQPRGKTEYITQLGQAMSDEVDRLISLPLASITATPAGNLKSIELPFDHVPNTAELVKQSEDKTVKGYYARLALDRTARGETIPASIPYPVQTWAFGNDLVMVFLAGEVVVDYSLRLKKELGAERLWINAYANDVPCYIASRRVIREGGYEAESSMYFYDKPSKLAENAEDLIVTTVHEIIPESFKSGQFNNASSQTTAKLNTADSTVHPRLVDADRDGTLRLIARSAKASGPEIKYMPEWDAFGWFTSQDKLEWKMKIKKQGEYEVHLEWSVSDEDSGRPYILEAGSKQLAGKAGKTGGWDTFKTENIGKIYLSKGVQGVVFRPDSKFEKGALLDFRAIRLIPVNK